MDAGSSNITLHESQASHNRANEGGLLYMDSAGTVHMFASKFSHNEALYHGAVILIEMQAMENANDVHAMVHIQTSVLEANSASDMGGVFYIVGPKVGMRIEQSYICHNRGAFGGVIRSYFEGSFHFSGTAFVNNSAILGRDQHQDGYAGVMRISLGMSVVNEYCLFENNSATYGGVYTVNDNAHLYDFYSVYRNNLAIESGGVLSIGGNSSAWLSFCNSSNNTARFRGGVVQGEDDTRGMSIYITNSTFIRNKAALGGALSLQGGELVLSNTMIAMNTASDAGAAVLAASTTGFKLQHLICHENMAPMGGCLHLTSLRADIQECEINLNSAEEGGSLCLVGETSYAFIESSKLANNSAVIGGALHLSKGSAALLMGATLCDNRADLDGGAIMVEGGMLNASHSVLCGNHAAYNGGAIIATGAVILLHDIHIADNVALKFGGVIHKTEGTSLSITASEILHNKVHEGNGGVVSSKQSSSYITMFVDCVIRGNYASLNGGVMITEGSSSIQNSLLEQNSASWGMIYLMQQVCRTCALYVLCIGSLAKAVEHNYSAYKLHW
eukprot:gene10732-12700_t